MKKIILYNKKKTKNNNFSWVIKNYYIIAIAIYFINLFFSFRVGLVCGMIMMFIVSEYFVKKIKKLAFDETDIFVFLYVIYNILTIFIGALEGYSISIGISEFSNSILPIIFYFTAKDMNLSEEKNFINSFIISAVFLVIIGIIMYVTVPNIYISYMKRTMIYFYLDSYLAAPRMHSFTGSVIVGSISSMGLALSLYYVIIGQKIKKNLLHCMIFLVGIILTSQRSAMAFAIIVIAFMMVLAYKINSITFMKCVKYGIVISLILIMFLLYNHELLIQTVSRILSIGSAVSERNQNWGVIWEQGLGTIAGTGLGSKGHRGIGINDIIIADGNYPKMIYEIGLFGFALFFCIMLITILKGLRDFKEKGVYLCIVSGILGQAIGSNVLCFQLIVPMFWFSIGRINCKKNVLIYKNKTAVKQQIKEIN